MITGSHNPPQDIGIKITFGRKHFFFKQIEELYQLAHQKRPSQKGGHLSSQNILSLYAESLLENLSPPEPLLKIEWHPGNGAFVTILKQVTDRLPHTSVILHEQVDGFFPLTQQNQRLSKNSAKRFCVRSRTSDSLLMAT
jgi:phosphomannomutase